MSAKVRHIFRWDLDKTYLKTEFETVRDLVRTARTPAELRENVPGSAALIRAIRDYTPRGFQHLVFFISGSPQQMRGVIEKKFALDGFSPDGFVLKPTVGNLLRGRFRAIRGQVAYKLAELIVGRAEAPVGTEETLFGDDAESDAFIYSLYSDVVAGAVSQTELREILKRAGAYGDQIASIEEGLEAIVHERPVRRIIIHLDQRTPPAAFSAYFPLVVPIYNHLQTAIVLYLDGTLGAVAIRGVASELVAAYGFDVQRLANLSEDILRRIRHRYPLESLDRLAAELRTLARGTIASEGDTIEAATQQILEAIAERATYLRGRPLLEEPSAPPVKRDYLKLLDEERTRKEEIKKARKVAELAAKRGRSPDEDQLS
ncbi:hypothetical protein L6R52_19995 [Myxococcota bacterium]|nr:hypothetical protein [Myxococcota bacterium]